MGNFNLKKHAADMEKELKMGIEVEREHGGTLQKIKKSIANGRLTLSDDEVFEMIAKDHLKEFPDYYTRLKKMEEG